MGSTRYDPTPEQFTALGVKITEYQIAKGAKDFAVSDKLRAELTAAGVVDLDTNPKWHPVFESVESRQQRLGVGRG